MDEVVLMESLSLRHKLCTDVNTAILDKIGQLVTLPYNGWATKENVAKFYQVNLGTLDLLVKRHFKELREDGYKVLSKKEFENLHDVSFKVPNRGLSIFPRRAILRIGMLLRDSLIAKQVRSYLLNKEEYLEHREFSYETLSQMVLQLTSQATELGNHAKKLEQHAIQLKQQREEINNNHLEVEDNTAQLTRNAEQLIFQSKLIKAMVEEMYESKHQISKVGERVDGHEIRLEALEKLSRLERKEQLEFISKEQIEFLKARVKAKGREMKVWSEFKKQFGITRYQFLPKNQFREALDWLETYNK